MFICYCSSILFQVAPQLTDPCWHVYQVADCVHLLSDYSWEEYENPQFTGVLQLISIRDECPPLSITHETSRKTQQVGKTNSLSRTRCWILNQQSWMPPIFFSEGDRINSELVYAVPKINLIQKGSRGQSHHLPCPLRQIIAKIVSTLCIQETKAGGADNSI